MAFRCPQVTPSKCPIILPSMLSISKHLIAGLGLFLVETAGFLSFGYIFLTSSLLIVTTVCVTLFSSPNPQLFSPNQEAENQEEEEFLEFNEESYKPGKATDAVVADQTVDKGIIQIHEQIQGQDGSGCTHRALNYLATISEDECIDDDHSSKTSDDDEDENVAQSTEFSEDDGSISDEDTLIEIELPTGNYLGPEEHDQHRSKLEQILDYYSCNMKQQSWMELLSEVNELMNEEENLIEIDISIGSIICPRFEIDA